MAKGIGRKLQFGIAKEATRGTAETSVDYWLAWAEVALEEKFQNAIEEQAYGVIEDSIAEARVKDWSEGPLKANIGDKSIGLLLLSLFGTDTPAAQAGGNSSVYDHVLTVQQGAQHQSLTFFVHDTLAGQDYSHALGVVTKVDIDFALGKIVEFNAGLKSKKGVAQSSYTPAQVVENRFVPQYMVFKVAPTIAGVGAGVILSASTTNTSTAVTGLSSTLALQKGMAVSGTGIAAGTTIAAVVSSTAITLSAAATATGSPSLTFTAVAIKLKSAKITIDSDSEDQDVLGSTAPEDFLNKNFKAEGTIEAIWQNESDFKTFVLAGTAQALLLNLQNTDVTIGASANPGVKFEFTKVTFEEITRPLKAGELVYQTLKFKAHYSTTDSYMVKATVTNLEAAY